jgi:hypothetical protein
VCPSIKWIRKHKDAKGDFSKNIENRESSSNPEDMAPRRFLTQIQLQDENEEADRNPGIENNSHGQGYDTTRKLSWKRRIRHITWAYFTLTMATGGIANVLYTG